MNMNQPEQGILRDYTQLRINLLEGRPRRERVIEDNDLINLKIALNTCETWEEFDLLV